MGPYPLLRAPIAIGPVTAPNRLMMTTHGPRLPQARYLRYLDERARNGVGLAGFNLGPLGVMQFPFGPGKAPRRMLHATLDGARLGTLTL